MPVVAAAFVTTFSTPPVEPPYSALSPDDFDLELLDEVGHQELARRADPGVGRLHPVDDHAVLGAGRIRRWRCRRPSARRWHRRVGTATDVKSRPRGSRSNTSLATLVARIACVMARRGEPAHDLDSLGDAGGPEREVDRQPRTEHERDIGDPRRVEPVEPGGHLVAAGRQRGISIPAGRVRSRFPAPGRSRSRPPPTRPAERPPCTSRTTPWTEPVCSWPATVAAARRQQVTAAAMSRCTVPRCRVASVPGAGRSRDPPVATSTSIADFRRIPAERCHHHAGTSDHPGTGRVRGRIRLTTRRWAPP